MVLQLVRVIFLLAVLAATISYALQANVYEKGSTYVTIYILVPAIVAFVIMLIDMLWHRKRLQVLSGLFFGILAGLVIAYVLTLIVNLGATLFPAPQPAMHPGTEPEVPAKIAANAPEAEKLAYEAARNTWLKNKQEHDKAMRLYRSYAAYKQTMQLIKLLLGAAAVFVCTSFVLQTKDDFRFVIPYVEFSKQTKGARPLLLDTSVIIDGRIADIADTKILESEVIVPRFILAELQTIADSDEKLKRNRGRRGLDILNRLQNTDKIDIHILDADAPNVDETTAVDAKLVALAKHLDGRVITNDYNLNKVAQLRGVDVININDLANALKPVMLPGESLTIKILKPGEEPGQGVGYLEDGTMVVAEQARDVVGREITITVTSVIQTSAGRMIFGKLDPEKSFSQRRT
ncbi:MAG: PIN/TRAM domain-containing protein [Planctomycetota bacterium]|nr:PIN/TRAM domain-containing protein [Planctomycetota bacterium]